MVETRCGRPTATNQCAVVLAESLAGADMADIANIPPLSGRLQALLLSRPIEVWTADDATSGRAYTEQGPRPGIPVADAATHARLLADGDITGTADYEVRTQHGGLPGQVDHGMTAAVRRTGEALYTGHEQPGVLSAYDVIDSAITGIRPDIVAHPNGTLITVVEAGAAGRVYIKAPGDTSWTNIGTATSVPGAPNTSVSYPCLVVVEDDVYLLAWRQGVAYDPASGGSKPNTFISTWVSADAGLTWALAQDYSTLDEDVFDDVVVATDPAGGAGSLFACGRIRAAYNDGEVSVWAHLKGHRLDNDQDVIRQFAGASLAERLEVVETYPPALHTVGRQGRALPDVVATPTGFAVSWLQNGKGAPQVATIGSAWQPLSTAQAFSIKAAHNIDADGGFSTAGAGTAEVLDDDDVGENALAYDPAGSLWCYTCTGASAGGVGSGVQYAYYSGDGGEKWTAGHATIPSTNDISGYWFYPEDLAGAAQGNRPAAIGATWWRGAVNLAVGSEGTTKGSGGLAMVQMGGWTDLVLPYERHGVRIGHRQGWLRTWMPWELPENQLYTASTALTFTSALTAGAHAITTGDGAGTAGTNNYRHVGVDNGITQVGDGEVDCAVAQTQGIGTTLDIGFAMRLASTTHGVEFACVRTATSIAIRDVVAGTELAHITGLTSGARYVVRWGLQMHAETGAGRALQVWYRLNDGSTANRRQWTRIGAYTLTDDSGAGGVVPHMDWGHLISSGGTTQNQSTWFAVSWAFPYSAGGLSPGSHALWPGLNQAGGDNPDVLAGRPVGTAQDWCLDGLLLSARRGPARIGDSWTTPVSGDYEVARALSLDAPSRRIHHRSVDDSAQVIIPWAVDAARPNVEDAEHEPLLALRLWCNWRTAFLEYLPQGGAWTQAAAIDSAVLQGASFVRTGKTIRASGTASTVYLHRDEVDGDWTAEWDNGAGTTRHRHPAGNGPGRWSSSTSEPRARLTLDSTLAGDPTTGGTLSLWSPEVTILVPGQTATAWRLRIPAQTTADGDLRTKIAWCDAHVIAQPPSWGRGYTAIPGHERVALEGDVGVRVSRSPASRELRMAWDEGVDESDISGTAEVRYVTPYSSGSEPAASLGEIPRSLVRMLERQDGRPVGWCVWDQVAAGAVQLRRRNEQLWGTVESAPDLEVVLGDAGETEVVRVATMTLREER
jgi:hypothetical protein